jgi:hypothetical protein
MFDGNTQEGFAMSDDEEEVEDTSDEVDEEVA